MFVPNSTIAAMTIAWKAGIVYINIIILRGIVYNELCYMGICNLYLFIYILTTFIKRIIHNLMSYEALHNKAS